MELNWLLFVFIIFSLAELSIQIVVSELSHWVKGYTGLSQPFKYNAICKLIFWRKLFGKSWLVLSPLLLLISAFFILYSFVSKMLDCPYCIVFHLAWTTNIFYFKMDIITALLLAPLALVGVAILDRIHTH